MRLVVVALLAAACGRVGFDATGDGGGGGGGGDGAGGDGKGTDAPMNFTCGNATCEGTGGETCKNCTMDCRTTADVCGNGACGPSENGTSCFVDCGPMPWAWQAEEADLLMRINEARTVGTSCGGGPVTTAAALTIDDNLKLSARDLAWEQARYGGLFLNRCDGQSMISYISGTGATSYKIAASSSSTTNAQRMADWTGDTMSCQTLMSTSTTRIGLAIAVDANNGYVALFR